LPPPTPLRAEVPGEALLRAMSVRRAEIRRLALALIQAGGELERKPRPAAGRRR
jgi:hypothetical protein